MRNRRALLATGLFGLLAGQSWAQFDQYTQPGSLAVSQTPTKKRLELAMEDARWHWGPLDLGPWFALKDFTYVNNVFGTPANQISDFTATAGLGVQGYLHAGRKVVLAFDALPEYVWWRDLAERRVWNGRYGAGLFAYFNRLTLEATASTSRQQGYFSSELDQPVNERDDRGSATLELKLSSKLSLVATASLSRWRFHQQGIAAAQADLLLPLERNESLLQGGLRYYLGAKSSIGIGVTHLTTNFLHPQQDRSSSGNGAVAELVLNGARSGVSASVFISNLKPAPGSAFVPFDRPLGRVLAYWRLTPDLTWRVYGARNLVYSLAEASPYFQDERVGIAADTPLGWRSTLSLFAEDGRFTYAATAATVGQTSFTLASYGATLNLALNKMLTLVVGGSSSRYTSGLYAGQRSIARIQTSVQFNERGAEWW